MKEMLRFKPETLPPDIYTMVVHMYNNDSTGLRTVLTTADMDMLKYYIFVEGVRDEVLVAIEEVCQLMSVESDSKKKLELARKLKSHIDSLKH